MILIIVIMLSKSVNLCRFNYCQRHFLFKLIDSNCLCHDPTSNANYSTSTPPNATFRRQPIIQLVSHRFNSQLQSQIRFSHFSTSVMSSKKPRQCIPPAPSVCSNQTSTRMSSSSSSSLTSKNLLWKTPIKRLSSHADNVFMPPEEFVKKEIIEEK